MNTLHPSSTKDSVKVLLKKQKPAQDLDSFIQGQPHSSAPASLGGGYRMHLRCLHYWKSIQLTVGTFSVP